MSRLRVAFVVQRYGLEVNGGSEALCRLIAERMARFHQVEVLTTRAVDYVTWRDEYPEGTQSVNGIPVRRFGVDRPRGQRQLDASTAVVFGGAHSRQDEVEWMKRQGPYSSRLFAYIAANRNTYDVFVFFTYLYCTTFFGLPLVKEKAVLVSTCHDEPPIYLSIFDTLFRQVRRIVYLTPEERAFAQRRFYDCDLDGEIIGIGVEPVADLPPDPEWEAIRQRLGHSEFILYLGRIDESKGCKALIEHFTRYVKEASQPDLKLVLVGKQAMQVPAHPQIVTTGFVSELTKRHAVESSRFMVAPSPYESLCMAILESWLHKRPVLVNGDCAVLRGQCLRSNGGLWYSSYEEFKEAMELLLKRTDLAERLGEQGHAFVLNNCIWPLVDQKYLDLLSSARLDSPQTLLPAS
jgi:glycosyltransferase involved in cell wall biosynthesis